MVEYGESRRLGTNCGYSLATVANLNLICVRNYINSSLEKQHRDEVLPSLQVVAVERPGSSPRSAVDEREAL